MKLPTYPRTKPSGVEWLGDVPEHWDTLAVKRRFHIVNGGTPSSSEDTYWEGDIPWFTPEDLGRIETKVISTSRRQITKDGLANCGASLSPRGSVLVSTRAPIGHVAVLGVDGCCNQGCRILVPEGAKVSADFGFYVVVASNAVLNSVGKGTTFLELSAGALGAHFIPLPDPAEQRAIAAYLDRETGRVDRLVAKKRELIERLQEKRTALISRTVARGLPPAAARAAGLPENPPLKPSGVAWLDDVPEHWTVSKIKHIKASTPNAFVDGPFGSNLKTEHFVSDGDVFVIESSFATRGELNEENLKTIEMEHFLTIKRSATTPGDIIIAKIGAYFGLNHILPPLTKPAVVSGNSLKLTVHPKSCSAAYFHYQLLHLKWCGAIDLLANITAQPALSLGGMNTLACVQPPLPEQAAIAAYLDEETAKLDALVGKVEAAVERLQEYRTALITAAVTGKIDVREESHA